MPKLIKGEHLTTAQIEHVKAAFIYRWTIENPNRKTAWRGLGTPTIPLQHDAEWIREHAFYINKDGSFSGRHKHAEPHYLAEEN